MIQIVVKSGKIKLYHVLMSTEHCTTCYGTDTVRFMGQRTWEKLPIEVKTSVSLTVLKNILKQQNANIATVGFAKLLYMV